MVAQEVGPERFKGQEDVREVEEPSRVERRVGSVWWQRERKAARYEAVEGGVKVAGTRYQYHMCKCFEVRTVSQC